MPPRRRRRSTTRGRPGEEAETAASVSPLPSPALERKSISTSGGNSSNSISSNSSSSSSSSISCISSSSSLRAFSLLLLFLCVLLLLHSLVVPSPHRDLGPTPLTHVAGSLQDPNPYQHRLSFFTGAQRAVAGFADLALGKTHYYSLGDETRRDKIVFIHGVSSVPVLYADFLTQLSMNYHVICYDLYGRGHSDSPGFNYNEYFYSAQLALLLDKLEIHGKIHLIGYSQGGAIATHYSTVYPERIAKLVLIAPAGLMPSIPLLAHIAKIPLLGDLFVHTIGKYLYTGRVRDAIQQSRIKDEKKKLEILKIINYQILNHPGIIRAIQSTAIHYPLSTMGPTYYSRLPSLLTNGGASNILAIWGQFDTLINEGSRRNFEMYVPGASSMVISNATHELINEFGEEILAGVLWHLSEGDEDFKPQ